MKIGSLVKLTKYCLCNPPGTLGYVYDIYEDFDDHLKQAVSVIFVNGEYDGFSVKDQAVFLEHVADTNTSYNFINVMQLSRDFEKGQFNTVLNIIN